MLKQLVYCCCINISIKIKKIYNLFDGDYIQSTVVGFFMQASGRRQETIKSP